MPQPRLIISVTGGAQDLNFKPRVGNLLKQGLVGAAVNTGRCDYRKKDTKCSTIRYKC